MLQTVFDVSCCSSIDFEGELLDSSGHNHTSLGPREMRASASVRDQQTPSSASRQASMSEIANTLRGPPSLPTISVQDQTDGIVSEMSLNGLPLLHFVLPIHRMNITGKPQEPKRTIGSHPQEALDQ